MKPKSASLDRNWSKQEKLDNQEEVGRQTCYRQLVRSRKLIEKSFIAGGTAMKPQIKKLEEKTKGAWLPLT
jgi:hypothetical protein